ncbi:MAG: fructosamine kinase family protein [Phycisphaerales bacterium]|nr:fructosamine kinase family protein [Planctomycetota bacterium]MCH8508781.1 fructosamine kinase family protein [Phycisphaerales bacterium]
MDARALIEDVLGEPIGSMSPLRGGCVAEVYRVRTRSGRDLAVKVERGADPGLDLEAGMLAALDGHAPVPQVVASSDRVLALDYIENGGGSTPAGERRLAEIVAGLHAVTSDAYGFDADTRIGPIRLVNGRDTDWARFSVERRLRPVCGLAVRRGALPRGFAARLDEFARRADAILGDPGAASLIHGDLWAGNVLWREGMPAALIDPSTQWADPEFELAFIDLMGGVSGAFWDRYEALRPARPGFHERRIHAYQVFPLAVHAALFGGGYGAQAMGALERALS